ncbi:E3 ubiquitin-protein ligase TRIM39 [Holothuria leucospilota]|uniref:E3 ubiquitin-protein ligase TRIM39 n=1 Tax=Holothuria leucospilota TaxID=206669 RepID=A0A9Q0YIL9_HOLLE|nr:E3 ubiquitin-protein ligase TRIM39 [Holothuria leucospilota]
MVGSDSYILCPTCRTEVCLPRSGRVEDFTTNYELMNFTSDHPVMDQNRWKRKVLPIKRRRVDTGDEKCQCYQHKKLMEFYCETCKKQVCDQCLLGDHNIRQHRIVSASDVAANLSDQLQRLTEELQCLEQDKKNVRDKIPAAKKDCQKEKQRLKNVVDDYRQTRTQQLLRATDEIHNKIHEKQQEIQQLEEAADEMQKKIQQLRGDADEMCNEIDKKAAACERTYDGLQQRYSRLTPLHYQIQGKCIDLDQNFQQHDLTRAGEVQQVYQDFQLLKSCTDSLQTDFQSNSIGLSINEAKYEILGIRLRKL